MSWLALLFALTALIYASVGFGGGSTYTALLALSGVDFRIFPVLSLCCNLIVVTGGVWRFSRADEIPWSRALPICVLSVPMAWIGGRLDVPETLFIILLALSLFVAGLLLLFGASPALLDRSPGTSVGEQVADGSWQSSRREMVTGGGIGFLSGLIGIGGGIFLSPILHLTRWGKARAIAGTASLFILVNSVAGLIGQLSKFDSAQLGEVSGYWPLFLAVLLGGQVGSRIGVTVLPPLWIKRLTAILILVVAVRLLWRLA